MQPPGTNFSTIYRDGVALTQLEPLKANSPWASKDGKVTVPYEEVCDNMSEIGTELTVLQMSKLCSENQGNQNKIKIKTFISSNLNEY